MSEIKTPLRYPGGKTRAAEMLTSSAPYFEEYREPFIGGGSVFIKMKQKNPTATYWINDLYYDLFCFWDETKNNVNEVIEIVRKWKRAYPNGRDLYAFLCAELLNFSKLERAAAFLYLIELHFLVQALVEDIVKAHLMEDLPKVAFKELLMLPHYLKMLK